jgi:glycosyltransferase involved in cell wall biosynthesis
MNVGFYIDKIKPVMGGGYSFVSSIQDSLINRDDIKIIYITKAPCNIKCRSIEHISIYDTMLIFVINSIIRRIFRLLGIQYSEKKRFQKILKKENIDILWIPGPFELNDIPIPYIFTVWDIGHRTNSYFPELSNNGEWEGRERLYLKMLYKASYVITGNETAKKELLENYPMNPDKIKVVPFPNPVSLYESLDCNSSLSIEYPYIFYPAQFWPHKNHISLVETIKYLHDNNYQIHCYFTGSDKGNMIFIKTMIKKYHLEKYIHILGFVDIDTLIFLYKNALALTFISLLGPNNLPPIEAVSLGCPVIISNLPGHLEQMGDAAIAVDGTDPIAIGDAVIRLLFDAEFRNELVRKGNELVEKQKKYNYFVEIANILSDFQKIRKTWQ